MTTVTPIRQPPMQDLLQIIDLCVCYGDTQNVSAESAQQQLGRIRGLLMQALAKLGEPHQSTIEAAKHWGRVITVGVISSERDARDLAAVVTHTALTWGIVDTL